MVMTPEELGFSWNAEDEYWFHPIGSTMEIALEPYGANLFQLAFYQHKLLLSPKVVVRIHSSGTLLIYQNHEEVQ
jgi:hypothetical protein